MRSRSLFRESGIATAVIDAPSDRKSSAGVYGFRASEAHAEDLHEVAAYLREAFALSAWLVGTSRDTESAANAAASPTAQQHIAGVVLTAATLRSEAACSNLPGSVFDVALERVLLPTCSCTIAAMDVTFVRWKTFRFCAKR